MHTRGLRLHAAIAGDPISPLIILLHGNTSGWFEFQHVLPLLADAGYRACAVSLRGYGLSDRPPSGYEIRHAVGDISGTLRALGHTDAVLIGNGTGGAIAWTLAAAQPHRVRALISINAIHPTDLRRAIAARPWLYTSELARWPAEQILRQPFTKETFPSQDPDYNQRVQNYQYLCNYAQHQDKAKGIILKTSRLAYTWVPSTWFSARATAPALILHNNQPRWKHLVRRAATRTLGELSSLQIPGAFPETTQLPHLENPNEFVEVIQRYITSVESL
ncbi:alpha/beta fold hydrolase [Corynebacterium freiburgense]|uniref:alpha/beta fold hydrolase n=1 Tax=Corynebacterium freiburgense TaxID=556548 RepID=UPI000404826A|nr:alpha/beta hydrolase [Corynebacterium freiburgense]